MASRSLEQRIASLEQRVAELEAAPTRREKDWRRTIGMFSGDPVMQEICQTALEFRKADRQAARRRSGRQ